MLYINTKRLASYFGDFKKLSMAGLVADYGSESEDDDSDSLPPTEKTPQQTPLPKPDFIANPEEGTKCSVLINPFIEADNAKAAILEKHVKMISTDVKTVNGKKICWNYRKNKCRFGHNCKFAHDSDLQMDKSPIIQPERNLKQIIVKKIGEPAAFDKPYVSKKKRVGMSEDFVPSKKVIKMHNKQRSTT